MAKLRAAAYCRVSSNKSIQLRSLKAQKKYYEEYFRDNPLYEYVGICNNLNMPMLKENPLFARAVECLRERQL